LTARGELECRLRKRRSRRKAACFCWQNMLSKRQKGGHPLKWGGVGLGGGGGWGGGGGGVRIREKGDVSRGGKLLENIYQR